MGRMATWRKQWMYRITNRSVVVQRPGRGIFSTVYTVPLGDISDLYIGAQENGLGTVIIGYPKTSGKLTYLRLESIENAREVRALIDNARKNATVVGG
jgi:hypothetical protein